MLIFAYKNPSDMKTVVLDGYGLNPGDLTWDGFREFGEVEVYDRTAPQQVAERAADADAVLTNKTVLDGATLRALPRLRYVGVLATGYNVVDTDSARELGITVTNIPAYSTASVAQMALAHLLAITNCVEHYTAENRAGRWSSSPDFCYWDEPVEELAGKTMGIVGFGNTGSAVARIALALGMKVAAVTSKSESELPAGVRSMPLSQLLAESDVVSLHCPLTPDTRHIINADTLRLMKPSAILINTGRGPLVDEQALADALDAGTIRAAGVDVLSTEPPAADNPLLRARNCFITPHIAWASTEARRRLMDMAVDNLRAFTEGHTKNNVAQ